MWCRVNPPLPVAERRFRAVYRSLLRCFPPAFRDQYGLEMEEAFVDQLREARATGRGATALLLVSALVDTITNGFQERFAPQPKGAGMFHLIDVRYAFRLLRRSPVFSLLTVLVLSGGLGLAIFTFSFLHTAMLKPIPIADGNRVVSIRHVQRANSGPFDAADIREMREGARTVQQLGVYTERGMVLGDETHPRVVSVTMAEWTLFGFARVLPLLGRVPRVDDAEPGAERVLVLSSRLWKAAFGADPTIVGRTVLLDNATTRVIGVMPAGFGFPVAAEAWMPLRGDAIASATFGAAEYYLFGRLGPGANADQARAELRVLFKRARAFDLQQTTGDAVTRIAEENRSADVVVETFPMAQMGDEGPLMLAVLNILATLILLLACINVMNLLLARSNERVRETAVRLALGASRGRLIMQSMWESVLLCTAGGIVATAVAAWGLDAINAWAHANLEGNLAFWWVWGLDRSAIIAAGLFVTATIALLGMVVAGRATSLQFVEVLKDGSARSGSRREGRVVRALVITQVATVSVLMFFGVMAGIVAYRVANVDAGFDTHRLLTTNVALTGDAYSNPDARNTFWARELADLSAAPSVQNVLMRANLASITDDAGLELSASGRNASVEKPRAYVQALDGEFATLGMSVPSGRSFDSRDVRTGAPVAIVSQAFADEFLQGMNAVGQQIKVSAGSGSLQVGASGTVAADGVVSDGAATWRTIVGVATNITLGAPFSSSRSALAVYVPLQQAGPAFVEILFRHRGDETAAQSALHRSLTALDASLLPPDVRSFDEILQKSALIAVSTARLFAACFGFALLLAVSGTYGLMARHIGQRTREIGVRRALGASETDVVRLLLAQGGRQLGFGVLISMPLMLIVGVGFSRIFPVGIVATVLSALLVGVTIVGVILVATFVPTRRAVTIELRDALRFE